MIEYQMSLFGETEYNTISTIQYLGSKKELLHWIIPFIEKSTKPGEIILDLFAGTGAVGLALKPRNIIYANDIQKYSYIINQALLLNLDIKNHSKYQTELLENYQRNYSFLENRLRGLLETEMKYLRSVEDISLKYQKWCDKTPFRFCNFIHDKEFEPLSELISEIEHLKDEYCLLFTTYYANAYFGLKQCMEIDSLKYAINKLPKNLSVIALTALMSVMSYSVTSTTHFAQYLKVKDLKTFENVKDKRSKNIKELFLSKYNQLVSQLGIQKGSQFNSVFNMDYKEILNEKSIFGNHIKLVYADPPYFKEHYSRYYHVIENLVNYNYPQLTYNSRINSVTVGRYSENRFVSDFGKKSTAPKAFEILAEKTSNINSKLYISYSNNSIVSLDTVKNICMRKFSKVFVESLDYIHSKQGRKEACQVQEYLIRCET